MQAQAVTTRTLVIIALVLVVLCLALLVGCVVAVVVYAKRHSYVAAALRVLRDAFGLQDTHAVRPATLVPLNSAKLV